MRPILDLSTAKIGVELTSRCNLRCGMCPMGNLGRPEDDMPWWVVQKIAADFRDNGIQARWLHEMGEPLLAEAIDLFPGVGVSTNVMMLDADYGHELLATSLDRIRLCVDTINPEVYPEIRRGGRWDEVVANIRTFLEISKEHEIRVEIQDEAGQPIDGSDRRTHVGGLRVVDVLDAVDGANVLRAVRQPFELTENRGNLFVRNA